MPEVRAVEVWFGYEVRGWLALATAPLHYAIFAAGAYAFWQGHGWAWSWAAGYAFYVALSHLAWNVTSDNGDGLEAGIIQLVLFSIPGALLLRARPATPRPAQKA
jgi:hypothetical protein